jgi:formate dehydrogenase major subunit
MTNHWIDIKNTDAVLIIGSNAAEHHPVAFKWIMRARDNGAVLMHVDPKFSRTSARCDFHVPLRSGTDIAFLGGMVNHIIAKDLYFKDYVANYTNAAFVVGKDYAFEDGIFSGYDPKTRTYDRSKWEFEKGPDGGPVMDPTLKNERCVFNLMKKHYERYTLKNVSDVTGVSEENLLRVYDAFCATGRPDKAGTILYALGWTQHTVGVQNIRTSTLIQLLLGNIGVAGGGINALRGEPNVQGSTDHALLYHILPGYNAMPVAQWQTLADYNKANTPVTMLKNSANWWSNRPKYVASLLKGWFGDAATPENDFCYEYLPKLEKGEDYSYMYVMDRMYHGKLKGGFIFGVNPMNSFPNTNKMRAALDKLDWLVCSELHNSETTDNWKRPGVDPKACKTEVFLLPSAHRVEKAGTISNSGRWLQWFDKAVEPGQARNFADIFVPLVNKIRALYKAEGGTLPDPVLKLHWTDKFDPEEWTRRINGFFWADTKVGDKEYKRGQLVPAFGQLKDDGSTSSLNWLYTGSYTEEDGNKSKRRDARQTPMQANIGLFPNWSWCWPVNRRILYNRASVDVNGKPWNPKKAVIEWDGAKWVGDVPDGPWPPMADKEKGKLPFIMNKDGFAQFYGTGRMDGPFPEHYEPAETPLDSHPFSKQLSSPVYKFHTSDMDQIAKAADPKYPIVLTTYSLTEHWCGGGETRNVPNLLETEPQLYIEMSPELAEEKGIKNGDGVIVESIRGRAEAIAMVTVRIRPFTVMGKTVHLVGMPFAYGWTTPKCGDSTNRLTVGAYDPNTTIPESKACLVNVRKADKLTEIA